MQYADTWILLLKHCRINFIASVLLLLFLQKFLIIEKLLLFVHPAIDGGKQWKQRLGMLHARLKLASPTLTPQPNVCQHFH